MKRPNSSLGILSCLLIFIGFIAVCCIAMIQNRSVDCLEDWLMHDYEMDLFDLYFAKGNVSEECFRQMESRISYEIELLEEKLSHHPGYVGVSEVMNQQALSLIQFPKLCLIGVSTHITK